MPGAGSRRCWSREPGTAGDRDRRGTRHLAQIQHAAARSSRHRSASLAASTTGAMLHSAALTLGQRTGQRRHQGQGRSRTCCEVAVIGGGLAGLSAARHAARLGRHGDAVRRQRHVRRTGRHGRAMSTASPSREISPARISPFHLLEDARKADVQVVEANIAKLELGERLTLDGSRTGSTYHPEAIIIASGASLRKLGVPGEEELTGAAFRAARPATAASFAARMSSWSAAVTRRCRRRSCSPRPAGA